MKYTDGFRYAKEAITCATKLTNFTVSKDDWNTKEGSGCSMIICHMHPYTRRWREDPNLFHFKVSSFFGSLMAMVMIFNVVVLHNTIHVLHKQLLTCRTNKHYFTHYRTCYNPSNLTPTCQILFKFHHKTSVIYSICLSLILLNSVTLALDFGFIPILEMAYVVYTVYGYYTLAVE